MTIVTDTLGIESRSNITLPGHQNRRMLPEDQGNRHCSRKSRPEERILDHRRAIERILEMARRDASIRGTNVGSPHIRPCR